MQVRGLNFFVVNGKVTKKFMAKKQPGAHPGGELLAKNLIQKLPLVNNVSRLREHFSIRDYIRYLYLFCKKLNGNHTRTQLCYILRATKYCKIPIEMPYDELADRV